MNRRIQGALLIGSLAVAIVVVLVVTLAIAVARSFDPGHQCETGFSPLLVSCTFHWSSTVTRQSTPIFTTPSTSATSKSTSTTPSSPDQPGYSDATSWAVADCPRNSVARRLLCATPSVATPAQSVIEDLVTGLPLPKPWFLKTAKNSPFIKSVHVETPLDLATALGFYRTELSKRGWTENDGAVVEPDRATIAFTTTDGPALLRLVRQDDTTTADLSLRKPAAPNAGNLPKPGQAKLMVGSVAEQGAVITVNQQTITLAARAGEKLAGAADAARALPDSQKIDLPPGKYKVMLKVASGTAQNRQFEVGTDETWALLVGQDGVLLPVRLY